MLKNTKLDIFKNKKLLIFCPHQDDEVNIAGGLILALKKYTTEIKIVYSTNGDYTLDSSVRYREAIASLKTLTISKDDIIFLGFPDNSPDNDTHLYMEEESFISKKNKLETYTPANFLSYNYKKHGTNLKLNKGNFINNIKEVIEDIKPDIIICIDYDTHPDHRALSLAFEMALGQILNFSSQYRPLVFKSFAYPTAYKSIDDFKKNSLANVKFNKDKIYDFEYQNPYYSSCDIVSFDIRRCVENKFLPFNKLFRAINKHRSQPIVKRAYRIINANQIYFRREVNNLAFSSISITSTSGNCKYLNDFMLFDSSNIMYGDTVKPILDKGICWLEKDDLDKKITYRFRDGVNIRKIKIYLSTTSLNKIEDIYIIFNNKKVKAKYVRDNFVITIDNLNIVDVDNIEILFTARDSIGITEIEILDKVEKLPEDDSLLSDDNTSLSLLNRLIFWFDDIYILFNRIINKILYLLVFGGRQ